MRQEPLQAVYVGLVDSVQSGGDFFRYPITEQMWQGAGRIFRALAEIEIDKSDISAVAIRSRKSRCHILEGITGGEHLWISRTFIM